MENNKFKTYDELLRVAKSLGSDEEKIKLICDYFVNNVTYNYAYLEAIRIDRSETGIEDMVSNIDSRYDAYKTEERKLAKIELERKMKENMKNRYKNSDILDQELQKLLSAIDDYYGTIVPPVPERKIVMFGRECGVIKATPERVISLAESIRASKNETPEKLNPTRIEEGLLKQGVCAEYAPYIKKYCDDLGIKCEIVHGQGTVGHVWNLININGEPRHLDLTNAIFIRDGYGENPAQAKPQDWYMATTEAIFRMQPCRKIERIGDNKPKQEITSENFVEQMQFINWCSKRSTDKGER